MNTHQQIIDALTALPLAITEKKHAALNAIRAEEATEYARLVEACGAIGHIVQGARYEGDPGAHACVVCGSVAQPEAKAA